MHLLESSGYTKTIQSNGLSEWYDFLFFNLILLLLTYVYFLLVFTDEELDHLLDRSDMIESTSDSKTAISKSAEHFKVIATS